MTLWHRFGGKLWDLLGESGWPGMDRRQWWWRRSLIGYRSSKMPILLLFLPHVVMIVLLTFCLPILVIAWLLGQPIEPEAWIVALIGLPFSLPFWIFVVLILGHRATIIDTDAGTVSEWRGLALPLSPIIPLMRRQHPLERFTAVQLTREVSRAGKGGGSQTLYVLTLTATHAADIVVVQKRRLLTIRRIAENVARRCGLPLRDRTADEVIERQADGLDLPLVDTTPPGPVPDPPRLPSTSTLRLPVRGARPWVATQDRPPFSGWRALLLTLLCGTLAYVATIAQPRLEASADRQPPPPPVERPSAQWQPPSPWPGRLARIGAQGLVLVQYGAALAALAALLSFSGRALLRPHGWRITVDARGLCVERFGLLGTAWPRRRWQALHELEEMRIDQYGGHWRLLAISDQRIIPIGYTFTHADVVALRQELLLALRAEAARR